MKQKTGRARLIVNARSGCSIMGDIFNSSDTFQHIWKSCGHWRDPGQEPCPKNDDFRGVHSRVRSRLNWEFARSYHENERLQTKCHYYFLYNQLGHQFVMTLPFWGGGGYRFGFQLAVWRRLVQDHTVRHGDEHVRQRVFLHWYEHHSLQLCGFSDIYPVLLSQMGLRAFMGRCNSCHRSNIFFPPPWPAWLGRNSVSWRTLVSYSKNPGCFCSSNVDSFSVPSKADEIRCYLSCDTNA